MIFNFKYLIFPLSIIVCINNNYVNAMEDKNPNEIMENNINNIGDNSKNNNNNKSEINNQQNNKFLPIKIDNENDKEKIKALIKQPLKNADIVKYLDNSQMIGGMFSFFAGVKQRYKIYYDESYMIFALLKSFNDWNSNATFTVNQLQTIYNIVKGTRYLLGHKGQVEYYNVEFAIDDIIFGVGLVKPNGDNHYNKCIFIPPNRYGLFIVKDYDNYYDAYNSYKQKKKQALTNRSFRNFIDAVKLCSTKKLPTQFTNNDNKYQYFVTSNEYRKLLLVLLRDFWIVFHGEYKYDLLRLSLKYRNCYSSNYDHPYDFIRSTIKINSNKEYEMFKKEYEDLEKEKVNDKMKLLNNKVRQYQIGDALDYYDKQITLKKITEAFEDEYDEKNFIEIFGEETINNIRYIIHHLIDIEINSNHELFQNVLQDKLSKENNLYGTMRKLKTKGKALIDKLVKELKNDKKLEQQFGQICKKVWTDNIVLPEDEDIFKKLGEESEIELSDDSFSIDENYDDVISNKIKIDKYKLSSKQRVENYLKKLLYDKTLDDYLRNKVFKYIISSTDLIKDIHKNPSGTQEDRDLVKEKHIENINSAYILNNILEYVKDSNSLKKGLFFNKKEDKNDKISNKINSNNKKYSDKFDTNNNKINNISDDNHSNKFDKNNKEKEDKKSKKINDYYNNNLYKNNNLKINTNSNKYNGININNNENNIKNDTENYDSNYSNDLNNNDAGRNNENFDNNNSQTNNNFLTKKRRR